jgi:hypothetical protein
MIGIKATALGMRVSSLRVLRKLRSLVMGMDPSTWLFFAAV